MDLGLSGKNALVTGGSKGIGRAVAWALAAEGVHLHLAARTAADLADAAAAIRARHGVQVAIHPVDLSDTARVAALAAELATVDILVNNAGAIPRRRLTAIDDKTWRESWGLKVMGAIAMTREVYAAMCARRAGVIVNVVGIAGERPNPASVATSSANAGLIAFTRALGAEAPQFGVRVLGVNPGLVETERTAVLRSGASAADNATWGALMQKLPFGRMARSEEVGELVAFLASARASYLSGTMVTIDGGAMWR